MAYQRRRPETTDLYKLVQEHYRTFVAMMDESGRSLPRYVLREFERYLDCGLLQRGFVRIVCSGCGFDRLVAFSCKSRSFCPACVGRHMNETAAHLVDHVIGDEIPVRQWVLTLPHPLRYLLAYDPSLCTAVLDAFIRSVFGWLTRTAKKELGLGSVKNAHPAAVTVVQRVSGHLGLNPHFHTLATDGVYVEDEATGRLVFRALPRPHRADVAAVASATMNRTLAVLAKRGIWLDQDPCEDRLAQDEPGLAAIAAVSLSGLLFDRNSQREVTFFAQAADAENDDLPQAQTPGYGFNVHAAVRIAADDRAGRERLCRYITRPELSQQRVAVSPDGQVHLTLKRPWSDGTTSVSFAPLQFMTRLAAMVHPPRMHRTRYHGLWAPHAARRAEVTKAIDVDDACGHGGKGEAKPAKRKRYDWASLLARVFAIDVLTCARCGKGPMQRIGVVVRADAVRAMLDSVGLAADSPVPAPSRWGEQTEMFEAG